MTGYKIASLSDMVIKLGESKVKEILSSFSCPKNKDVEMFLKQKAIVFSNQSLSKTYLIFTSYKSEIALIGYFTLANKYINVQKSALSKTLQKRISKFITYDSSTKQYMTSAYLIGQLGKNFSNGYNNLITGDELLQMAITKIQKIQYEIGGKIAYLECEDKDSLKVFYEKNGFVQFGKRLLEKDEIDCMNGEYLIQYLKYL